jgi:DNA-binding HxlR family transcriptional regulator
MLTTETRPPPDRPNSPSWARETTADARRLKTSDRELIERAGRGLDVIQAKWKVHLIVAMARGIRRHSRLHASLPGASKKVMTDCLRGLERDGIVSREIYAQVPVRVEYSLTPLGWTITDAIIALSDWSQQHTADVTRARSEYWLGRIETGDALRAGRAA